MKYVSLDIETTCLDPDPKNVLMLAMLVEDTSTKLPLDQLPKFVCLVRKPYYTGTPFALNLNSWILGLIAKNDASKYPIYNYDEWVPKAMEFLKQHFGDEKVCAAGKNVGTFDLQFFPEILKQKFQHRVLDPGSIFVDWNNGIPSLDAIKKKLNIPTPVTHDALYDAWDVIEVLRTQY